MALQPSLSPARNETRNPFQDATFAAQRFLSECERPRERLNHEAPTLAGGLGLRCEPGVPASDCLTAHRALRFQLTIRIVCHDGLVVLRPRKCGLRLPIHLTASERVRLSAGAKLRGVWLCAVAAFTRCDACGRGGAAGGFAPRVGSTGCFRRNGPFPCDPQRSWMVSLIVPRGLSSRFCPT